MLWWTAPTATGDFAACTAEFPQSCVESATETLPSLPYTRAFAVVGVFCVPA